MGMHIVRTHAEGVLSADVVAALREAAGKGPAVLIVPSFEAQIEARKQLAEHPDPALFGIAVTTLSAWVKERWGLWGTGAQLVEKQLRTIALEQVLFEAGQKDPAPGLLSLLSSLAERALPWLPLMPNMKVDMLWAKSCGLTDAEAHAVELVGSYAALIHSCGYIEAAEAAKDIVSVMEEAGAPVPALVVSRPQKLSRSQRKLLLDVARASEVWIVGTQSNVEADRGLRSLEETLASAAEEDHIACEVRQSAAAEPEGRAEELSCLRCALFTETASLEAHGAVRLAEPEGPLAEAELIAQEIERLAASGERTVVVATPAPDRAWRELAPKLAARHIAVSARLESPLLDTAAGHAFIAYAEVVAHLAELAKTWPEPDTLEDGRVRVRLGDMSWWPPRGLTDFLLCDIAHMTAGKAQALDAKWRSERLLVPADVLATLQNEKEVGISCARATQELLRGRIGTAAQRLLAPYLSGIEAPDDLYEEDDGKISVRTDRLEDPLSDTVAQGTLAAILSLAGSLKDLGISADPKAEHPYPLETVVALMKQGMGEISIVVLPEWDDGKAEAHVRIASASEAAGIEPCSADALICCGQTSEESKVETGDDVLSALLDRCCVEPAPDPMQDVRARFVSELSVPRHVLVVERTRQNADAKESYPSVMMTELLSAYGVDDGKDDKGKTWMDRAHDAGMPASTADEHCIVKDLMPDGRSPEPSASEKIVPAGAIGDASKAYVVVTPPGRLDIVDGRPLLSASQIESYLECPLKWFSLRRLRLTDSDTGFEGMEIGTFVHSVLESSHRKLLEDALAKAGMSWEELDAAPWTPLPDSRVDMLRNPERMSAAQKLLGETFDELLEGQYVKNARHQQPLVPHTEADLGALRRIRHDLDTFVGYEAGLFEGFEPRHFEWSFGGKGEKIEYADAYLTGTIDRVDIDGHGSACVIDYKHKSASSFAKDYAVFPGGAPASGAGLVLPRRVQSLIYGQVMRRQHPELHVVAAVYLSTQDPHAVSGAVSENLADRIFGEHAPGKRTLEMMTVPDNESFGTDEKGMDAVLDATEELIRQKIHELMEGNIEAAPCDVDACTYCPVLGCERRLG